MASLWSRIFRKPEKRLTVAEWGEQIFKYQGSPYLIGSGSGLNQGSEEIGNDYISYVQGAYKASGVVFACITARMLVFSEARFQFQRLRLGRPGDLFGTADLSVLEHPWPNGTTGELLSRALQDADLSGNHYVVSEGSGKNERLRRLRPDWTTILLTAPPDEAVQSDVAGYLYRPGDTQDNRLWEIYPIDGSRGRIAHWSPIPDPEAQYRGMSWLTPVIREIMADKAATRHKGKFFDNAATPALAVSLKETVTKEQFIEFMDVMNETKHGVDHAYETLYLGGGADVTVIGANLQQMDFKATQGAGESRIAAAARVHPVIAGLSEGLAGSSLNAGNFRSAWRGFADGTMRPLWRSISAAYEPLVRLPPGARLWYDDRDIPALQEDRKVYAEVQAHEASTIGKLVQEGFTPETVVPAVLQHDWTILKHTGLYSVQLQPPMPNGAPAPITPASKPTTPPKPAPPPGKKAAPVKPKGT